MNILVTGAKGMVGTALCNNLRNLRVPEGIEVLGVETVAQAIAALGLHGSGR